MMEAGNEPTLPLPIADCFKIDITNMVYMLLGPPFIDITS